MWRRRAIAESFSWRGRPTMHANASGHRQRSRRAVVGRDGCTCRWLVTSAAFVELVRGFVGGEAMRWEIIAGECYVSGNIWIAMTRKKNCLRFWVSW